MVWAGGLSIGLPGGVEMPPAGGMDPTHSGSSISAQHSRLKPSAGKDALQSLDVGAFSHDLSFYSLQHLSMQT